MRISQTAKTEANKFYYPALVISSLCLLIPAFYNHYPLVNPDTATYLASGFKPETPFDRPITYGLLIRLFTLNGLSLWLLVFAQGYLVSWLLFRIVKNLSNGRPYLLKSLLTVFLLSVCTSLSWLVSQVQPDVFTSVAFLCVIIILMGKEQRNIEVLLYILFFISVAVHLSHPLLMAGSLLMTGVLNRVLVSDAKTPWKKIVIMMVLAIGSIAIMGSALSKSKHVFFVGSLLEKGVLKKYLDDNCGVKNYKLCAYKDALPADANAFWWDNNSPLYKVGDWKGSKDEFNDIIHGVLTNPVYLKPLTIAILKQTGQQAITFNIGDGNQSFQPGSGVGQFVAEYFPREISQFNEAKQNHSDMLKNVDLPNKFFTAVLICSLLGLGYAVIKWKGMGMEIKLVIFVCVFSVIANCVDCAAFGILNGRYGCKMIWLLPFCVVAMMMINKFQKKRVNSLI